MTEQDNATLEAEIEQKTGENAPRKAKNFWPSAKRLFGLLAPFKAQLVAIAAMNLVCVFLAVAAPKVMGKATDVIFSGVISRHLPAGMTKEQAIAALRAGGQDKFADMASAMDLNPGFGIDFSKLGTVIGIVIAMYVVSSLFQWWQGYLLNSLVMKVVFDLRERIEAKINRLPLNYFDTQSRGDLLSRTTNDADNVQTALQQAISQLFYNLLMVIGITVMMFTVSWQLALVALLALPLTGVVIGVVGSRAQKQFKAQWKATGDLNGQVEEAFSGHDLATVFGRIDSMTEDFDKRNEELFRSASLAQFLAGMMMPIMQFISYLSYVVIAVLGALKVASGNLTLGGAQAFIQYSREFNQPLGQLGGMMQQVQSGVASAERVFEFLDAEEEPAEETTSRLGGRAKGLVEFDDVDFGYDAPLIQDLSLRVEPGQTAAIVGPTGAGKTTLVNLIMRFYDIDSGTIRLDGVDTAQMSRHELRSQVGMVLQDAVVFEGTIMDNIRYGRLDATDEEVIAAAKATYVDRFVHALPEGYDTVIDQDNGAISSGERQLITIARAFLAQPALLILDEATSSVDTRTEVLVQDAMNALRADRTSFIIAHRLSTIRDADIIIVMEEGRIVEQGTHAELLDAHGAYWRLHQSQFRED
ncbi:multidrug ABC transporter ATP-binding protein [Corynebacterium sp. HMSC056E09]|uniref:ABC transporter ATP-binding protein n=1 Tax=Corynebacterium sp. HMSC056E09 TaxID=1739416 RepID=UPI0008A23230|nr:ABC transporter ATP-binding protein [Corynebacterium sp. HMSC056E09]OFQ90249.1 multidrug ABC transporter ATP-binding protein [Corynebacterium sp. HMSC056E09]